MMEIPIEDWIWRDQIRHRMGDDPDRWIDPTWERADNAPSKEEIDFAGLWVSVYPDIDLMTEYEFHPKRKFRFDFCSIPAMVGIEIQGGTWTTGGHSTGKGIQRDYEKISEAQMLGWLVFPLTPEKAGELSQLHKIATTIQKRMESNGYDSTGKLQRTNQ